MLSTSTWGSYVTFIRGNPVLLNLACPIDGYDNRRFLFMATTALTKYIVPSLPSKRD